jgi:hypothetical protein
VDFKDALATYDKLDFKPEVRQKIMHDNAAGLLGISASQGAMGTVQEPAQVENLVGDIVREVLKRLGR